MVCAYSIVKIQYSRWKISEGFLHSQVLGTFQTQHILQPPEHVGNLQTSSKGIIFIPSTMGVTKYITWN